MSHTKNKITLKKAELRQEEEMVYYHKHQWQALKELTNCWKRSTESRIVRLGQSAGEKLNCALSFAGDLGIREAERQKEI